MLPVVISVFLFVLLVSLVTWLGILHWARPKDAIDRVKGEGVVAATAPIQPQETPERHPSLVLREVLQKLGNALPASPKDVSVMSRQLIRAGYRQEQALKALYGSKVALTLLLPLGMTVLVSRSDADPGYKSIVVLMAAALGFFLPNEYVKIAIKKRKKEIHRALPNALDLMVVCVESGLGLDQAILQVARELQFAHPEISEEFGLVNLELKAGKRRVEALRNLVERTNVDELKKLVAVLIQADRFGTGIAQSLRGHAEYMRIQTRQAAEEKAAKLGVKLVFPIFFCILPSLFVVTVGPVIVRIIRELLPIMQSI